MHEQLWKEKLKDTPHVPGVYIMKDATGSIIYVGKAIDLKRRIYSYFRNDNGRKEVAIAATVRSIDYVLAASERDALILERQLINRFKPFYNSMWKDDKSYPYVKLTITEDFPRLLLTRKHNNDGNEYFGPYPHAFQIKKLVKWLTKLFKLRPCNLVFSLSCLPSENKVKSCLYYQTGKCPGPCMGKVSSKEYKMNSKAAALFLKRKFIELKSSWAREMKKASDNLEYEKAADLRDRLGAIDQMSERVVIRELDVNDLKIFTDQSGALKQLKSVLELPVWPVIIEGFDISNISGTQSVGSMVFFRNGKPENSSYRRFKIKTVEGSDDFAMLKEVVYRRYNRLIKEKKALPDLVLIDGGKGQLSAAIEALERLRLKTMQIVSLAKKREEIYTRHSTAPVILDRSSPALRLLQHVRDEAHRFALAYHHKRRNIKLFS